MSPTDLSRHLGNSPATANQIDLRRLNNPPKTTLRQLKYIAVDKSYSEKRHKYLTIVLDLQSSVVVYVGDGTGAEAMRHFFERLRQSKATLAAISMDMSGRYRKAVQEHLPQLPVIFDRLRLITLLHETLSDLRRQLAREPTKKQQLKVLNGIRCLLPIGEESLVSPLCKAQHNADATSDRARLDATSTLITPLPTSYYPNEKLRLF